VGFRGLRSGDEYFVASHDPSTKVRLSEAESPYCVTCDYDHPGPCPE